MVMILKSLHLLRPAYTFHVDKLSKKKLTRSKSASEELYLSLLPTKISFLLHVNSLSSHLFPIWF